MAQQGPSQSPGFDLSKVTTADKLILGGAGAYFIWIFLPFWYSCCSAFGVTVSAGSYSGFRGVLIISWLLSILAIAEIVVSRIMGTELKIPAKRGLIHIALAAAALLFTLLGLVVKSTGLTLSWGIFVGIVLAGVWAYGAYMLFSQPEASA
jgi:hypothetical protein